MAFDGVFLQKVTAELKEAVDCHIDKIYQPSSDELVFLLRKKGFAKKLLISAKSGATRIHFTESSFENPETPPMLCMLLRKHLSGARLTDILQNGLERVAELLFSATNEMGDRITLRLVCELIGNRSNIILVNNEGRIIDSIRRSDIETSVRLIQPGAKYEYPEGQNKLNPSETDITVIKKSIDCSLPLSKSLLALLDGFSPLICREIEYKAETEGFEYAFNSVIADIKGTGTPMLLIKADGSPFDFTYTEISQYTSSITLNKYQTYCSLLDAFYTERENRSRINSKAHDIIRLVNNIRSRTEKKLALRLNELKQCENREALRINGELIKANLHLIENGSKSARVMNYYDPELKEISIPLNPALSPAANAAKYFKDYKKTYTAEQTLTKLTEEDKQELIYLDSVLESINRCENIAELSEIRDELRDAGYIKGTQASRRSKKKNDTSFKEYTSAEGYKILVGKNNRQNDYLTTTLASKNDMWFHTKNIPGSHVIVFCSGQPLSDETVLYAACLAAVNSKAADSANVPVDYTPVKYVKKPSGAKPGMVIYTTNKTVFVTPEVKK